MGAKKNFPLRIDEDIFNDLKRWADDEFRSVNSHIEFLLRNLLLKNGRLSKKSKKVNGEKNDD